MSDHIKGLGNETRLLEIEDFFFSTSGLFKFIDQLRTSVNDEVELVSAISEVVDISRDQGSPLGLLWYLPRREEEISSMADDKLLQRNFPSANLARPIDSVWTCLVCNDDTNPCLNDGICNTNSGTCECKLGWTGDLCQEPPLGNGICNLNFNTAEYNYDGGDCCAGTCTGEDCGKDDLPDPYSATAEIYVPVEGTWWYRPEDEWKTTFGEREFAYGVEIGKIEEIDPGTPEPPLRFSHCIDPNTALLTIAPFPEDEDLIELAGTRVRCDGILYLNTPHFRTNNRPNHIFEEQFRVPYGARCEIWFWFILGDTKTFLLFGENQSVAFQEITVGADSSAILEDFRIPESKCLWNTFVENHVNPLFTSSEYEEFAENVHLDTMCDKDPGEVLDRYAIWKILKSSSSVTDGDMSQIFSAHVCDFAWTASIEWSCPDTRRIVSFSLVDNTFHGALLTEIGLLTSLTSLDLRNNQLASIPSEIGRLTTLEILDLSNNTRTSIPSEVGHLTSLQYLSLANNTLTWIPPEIGNLTVLKWLDLRSCQLASVPSEVGRLTALETLHLSNNTLTSIPSELGRLASLENVFLNNNTLTWIPPEIGNLTSLKWLDLDFNPMTRVSLPKEVRDLESEGTGIRVCGMRYGFSGCLEHSCNDTEWSFGKYTCDTFNSLGFCVDEFLSSDGNIIEDVDEEDYDLTGKSACCICGGGNMTFL